MREVEPLDDPLADDGPPRPAGRMLEDQAEQGVVRCWSSAKRSPGAAVRGFAAARSRSSAVRPPSPRVDGDLAVEARVGVLGEPAGVVEQHPHRDPVRLREARGDVAGQHSGERVVEAEPALLDELQRRRGDERSS